MFNNGRSPRDIARALNRDHVPGPRGNEWRDTTIRGHGGRGTGILRNELYIGRLVWNRQTFLKDPSTGKRLSRTNPRKEWIEQAVPELRIVPQQLWDFVQTRLKIISDSPGAQAIKSSQFWLKRRPRHVLTGLVWCGQCGDSMAVIGKDYLRCRAPIGVLAANIRSWFGAAPSKTSSSKPCAGISGHLSLLPNSFVRFMSNSTTNAVICT